MSENEIKSMEEQIHQSCVAMAKKGITRFAVPSKVKYLVEFLEKKGYKRVKEGFFRPKYYIDTLGNSECYDEYCKAIGRTWDTLLEETKIPEDIKESVDQAIREIEDGETGFVNFYRGPDDLSNVLALAEMYISIRLLDGYCTRIEFKNVDEKNGYFSLFVRVNHIICSNHVYPFEEIVRNKDKVVENGGDVESTNETSLLSHREADEIRIRCLRAASRGRNNIRTEADKIPKEVQKELLEMGIKCTTPFLAPFTEVTFEDSDECSVELAKAVYAEWKRVRSLPIDTFLNRNYHNAVKMLLDGDVKTAPFGVIRRDAKHSDIIVNMTMLCIRLRDGEKTRIDFSTDVVRNGNIQYNVIITEVFVCDEDGTPGKWVEYDPAIHRNLR